MQFFQKIPFLQNTIGRPLLKVLQKQLLRGALLKAWSEKFKKCQRKTTAIVLFLGKVTGQACFIQYIKAAISGTCKEFFTKNVKTVQKRDYLFVPH